MKSTSNCERDNKFDLELGSGTVEEINENFVGLGNDLAAHLYVSFHVSDFFHVHLFAFCRESIRPPLW